MANRSSETSPRVLARLAGLLYLLLFPLGYFGILYVPARLIAPGDAATTAGNIMAAESLFRLSVVSALLAQIVNVLLVLVFYRLLKPASKNLASLMVVFFLTGVPIAMLNELNRLAVLLLLSESGSLAEFTATQVQALVPFFLDLHEHGVNIAQIFWGLWLLPLGLLVFKSGFLPRILGVLLVIGCVGYVMDSLAFLLLPNFEATASQFTFIGELLLPLWLLIRGVNVEQWEKRALEPA